MIPEPRRHLFFKLILCLVLLSFYMQLGILQAQPQRREHPVRQIGQGQKISKGVFIVADPRIVDSNFSRTVVLLLQHEASGSMGLIVNRPTDTPLSKLLPESETNIAFRGRLHNGGPVMQGTLTVLFRAIRPPKDLNPIFGQVFASQDARVFVEHLQSPEAKKNFRLFSGYAGWRPGQLRAEMDRGDWRIVDADAHIIFDLPVDSIWSEVFSRSQELVVKGLGFEFAS